MVCIEDRLLGLDLLLRESVDVELDARTEDGTPMGTEGNASNSSESKRLDDVAESSWGEDEGESWIVKSGRFRRGAGVWDDSERVCSVDFLPRDTETVLALEGLR